MKKSIVNLHKLFMNPNWFGLTNWPFTSFVEELKLGIAMLQIQIMHGLNHLGIEPFGRVCVQC